MKIGIFDSGLGGLTVVKRLMNIGQNIEIIYFADTLHVPYGDKKKDEILKFAKNIISFLNSQGCQILVSACGTISSMIDELDVDKEIVGVIYPSCIAANKMTKNGSIGVIGTTVSINSKKYSEILHQINQNFSVVEYACPLLVPLIEQNTNGSNNDKILNYLSPVILKLIEKKIDTLILGCTHYPIIKKLIVQLTGNIKLIDPGKETAEYILSLTKPNNGAFNEKDNKLTIFVSKKCSKFVDNASLFLGYIPDIIEKVF